MLRNAIALLRDFPLEELFLVTTAHRHSWVQYYIPDYGWIDFETTSSAIPPVGMGDPNARDVVIPLLGEEPSLTPIAVFPWRKVWRQFYWRGPTFSAAAGRSCWPCGPGAGTTGRPGRSTGSC